MINLLNNLLNSLFPTCVLRRVARARRSASKRRQNW